MKRKTAAQRPRCIAIIPSAGMGSRMGARKKNYLDVLKTPIIAHTLAAFEKSGSIDGVIVVVAEGDEKKCSGIVARHGFKKVIRVVAGAHERQGSVARGIAAAVTTGPDVIVVHDGARPLVTPELIDATVAAAMRHGAAIAGVRVKDTIKETSGSFVRRTVEREKLVSVQTPQAFKANLLIAAHERARKTGFTGTDESSLVERLGKKVAVVEGSYENIKVTTPEDLISVEASLKKRNGALRGKGR